jgi:hypothetical protein
VLKGLQWGHVSIDVEVPYMTSEKASEKAMLQWGHVSIDVEVYGNPDRATARSWLQWGHVSIDVEVQRSSFPGEPLPLHSFNGATSP